LKSNLISKSETTALLKTVSERWGIECPKIKNVKVHQI
jgi:PUA domain protein